MDAPNYVQLLLTGAAACLIAVPLAWLGVRGALRAIVSRLKHLESEQTELETRVMRLQKQRAADASIGARAEKRNLTEEAIERLQLKPPDDKKRPSAVNFMDR